MKTNNLRGRITALVLTVALLFCTITGLTGCSIPADLEHSYRILKTMEPVLAVDNDLMREYYWILFILLTADSDDDASLIKTGEDGLKSVGLIEARVEECNQALKKLQQTGKEIDSSYFDKISEKYAHAASLAKEIYTEYKTKGKKADPVLTSQNNVDILSDLKEVREYYDTFYNTAFAFIENYEGSFTNKAYAEKSKNAATLLKTFTDLTKMGYSLREIYQSFSVSIYLNGKQQSELTSRIKGTDESLKTSLALITAYKEKASELTTLASSMDIDVSGYENNLSTLEENLKKIQKINSSFVPYVNNKNNLTIDQFYDDLDAANETDRELSNCIETFMEYHSSVTDHMLSNGK